MAWLQALRQRVRAAVIRLNLDDVNVALDTVDNDIEALPFHRRRLALRRDQLKVQLQEVELESRRT